MHRSNSLVGVLGASAVVLIIVVAFVAPVIFLLDSGAIAQPFRGNLFSADPMCARFEKCRYMFPSTAFVPSRAGKA